MHERTRTDASLYVYALFVCLLACLCFFCVLFVLKPLSCCIALCVSKLLYWFILITHLLTTMTDTTRLKHLTTTNTNHT